MANFSGTGRESFILVVFSIIILTIQAEEKKDFLPHDARTSFEFGAVSGTESLNITQSSKLELRDIAIIVRSQSNSYHIKRTEKLRDDLVKQAELMDAKDQLTLKPIHESWTPHGAWTILPLVKRLSEWYSDSKSWIVFCEEETVINLPGLLKVLSRYDSKKELFLGHALQDSVPAIIHHFAFFEDPSKFSFPDFAAGWAITSALLQKLNKRIGKSPLKSDFSIDIQHEVAMYIRDEGKGTLLTDVPEFCSTKPNEKSDCVTNIDSTPPNCGEVPLDDIFFAIKTTKKFHHDRVPIVQKTMGKHAKHLIYYSETADPEIPTEDIGLPNTETGHCAKLKRIIEKSAEDKRAADKQWVVVADDDTIMSVPRLQRLLACYNPKEAMLFGERYGYGSSAGFGYDYITGGGGMILSRAGVEAVIKSSCHCWQADSPDDMWLGNCFRTLGIPVIHSPAFHQARPTEYVPRLLAHQTPVSFHKHYDIDPLAVYKDYLS